jgi:hypothetical protein
MNLAWVDLADYLTIAGAVLGIDPGALLPYADLHLAESALAAPAASYGGIEFYPAFRMKVAILGWHLVKNHLLPDGNTGRPSSPWWSSSSATGSNGSPLRVTPRRTATRRSASSKGLRLAR